MQKIQDVWQLVEKAFYSIADILKKIALIIGKTEISIYISG
jgi:hypothetical protein